MTFADKEYSRLMNEEGSDTEENPVADRSRQQRNRLLPIVAVILLLSLGLNIFQAVCRPSVQRPHQHGELGSKAAGLDWDVETVWNSVHGPYKTTDRAAQDEVWNADIIAPWRYVVALEDSHSQTLGLGHSVRWPWDHDKGVYILQTGHQIHCLHSLRGFVNGYYDGQPTSFADSEYHGYGHAMHCLDVLMQSVMCYADDSLLYVGHFNYNAKHPRNETEAGEGSARTCRDLKQLRSWVDEHSACYDGSYGRHNASVTETERYRFCPDGSKPWEDL